MYLRPCSSGCCHKQIDGRAFLIKKGTMKSKKITICGREVKMIYCAATENGYEIMRTDENGTVELRLENDHG